MSLPLILCYHKVERRHELGVTRISPRRFARHVERLARAGYRTISLHDVASCARGARPAGEREIAITFDDAYRGLRQHAFPVLAAHGFTASCFVITDYAGRLNRWDVAYGGRRFAHLAWRDVERWSARGIAFGSHTATHPRLTWLGERDAAEELARSRAAMHSALGIAPLAVSYPFGAAAGRELRLAREAGYELGFTLDAWGEANPMALPRLPVYLWSPPIPGVTWLAPLERLGARGANRCAVGTTIWKAGLGTRPSGLGPRR
jgi:peptidoglycan/xylan/chitin deacetylase (PgdA/CDA1 family)